MSNLLKKSKVYLRSAKETYKHVSEDDIYLTKTCFDLQQCIEFSIKYYLSETAAKYPRTHDLDILLELLPAQYMQNDVLQSIKRNAALYTSWETDSRYNDDFYVLREKVDEAFILCTELIRYMETLVSNVADEDLVNWCIENAPEALKTESKETIVEYMKDLYYKAKKL